MSQDLREKRRQFLQVLAGVGSYFYAKQLFGGETVTRFAAQAPLERLLIVYHPDGAFLDQWHPKQYSGRIDLLSESLSPLKDFREQLLLFRNLNLLDGSGDGHEDAARALLTGSRDAAQGSLDIHISDALKQALLHVGVQASKNQGHSVSFVPGGAEKVADDSPLAVYQRLFGGTSNPRDEVDVTLLKSIEKELQIYGDSIEPVREKAKIEQHLKQVRLLMSSGVSCGGYDLSRFPYDEAQKLDDKSAPLVMQMQIQNLVEALNCGLSRVATLHFSRHTSQLKMDFDFLARWNNQYPMESHQASHNSGEIHAQQKKWINTQLVKLFTLLRSRPEPSPQRSGSMLDNTLVVVVTEIAQGASHSRKDMPYYIVGGAGVSGYQAGRILDCQGAPHTQLLSSLSQLMGVAPRGSYASAGTLNGLLTAT